MKRLLSVLLTAGLCMTLLSSFAIANAWPEETENRYDFIMPGRFDDPDEIFPVCKDGLWGFVDQSGVEIVPPIYDWTHYVWHGIGAVEKGDKIGFVNSEGKLVIPIIYDNIREGSIWKYSYSEDDGYGVFSLRKDGLWGFITDFGKELSNFIYEETGSYSCGMGMIITNGKVGFISGTGGADIPPVYDIIIGRCGGIRSYEFVDGLAAVSLNGKWGYIRKNGSVAIAFQFAAAEPFYGELTCVSNGEKWGFINKSGALVIPYEYDELGLEYPEYGAGIFIDGEAYVRKNGLLGYIDVTGKSLRGFVYEEYSEYLLNPYGSTGVLKDYVAAKKDGKWGVVNRKSQEIVIPFMYDSVEYDQGSTRAHIGVSLNGKYGYIDINNNIIFPIIIDAFLVPSNEGFICYISDGRYGFMDRNHNAAIEPMFDDAGAFYSGLAAVEINGYWGYIDKAGNMVIQPEYDYANKFSEGLASVRKDGLWGFIDTNGQVVIPFQFSGNLSYYSVTFFDGCLHMNNGEGKIIVFDRNGNIVGEYMASDGYNRSFYDNPDKLSEWAMREGIFGAPRELSYNYKTPMTRAEVCLLLSWFYPYLNAGESLSYPITNAFMDTDNVDIRRMYELGVASGIGNGRFAPDENVTRQDFAVLLCRFMDTIGVHLDLKTTVTFSDENCIADYAAEAVRTLTAAGILKGSNGKFDPTGFITREQALACTSRVKQLTNMDEGKDSDMYAEVSVAGGNDDSVLSSSPFTQVQSLQIMYARTAVSDFTMPIGSQIPLNISIEPAGAEYDEEIIWASSDTSVFEVSKNNPEGTTAIVTIIGSGSASSAVLTVSIGNVKAECIVRVSSSLENAD